MPPCVHSAPATHGSRSLPNPSWSCPQRSPRCVPAGLLPPLWWRLERTRAEQLVTRGTRRAWRRYLADALALAAGSEDPAVAEARAVVEDVVHNHNQLELAL